MQIKNWLRVFRAQSAPLTIITVTAAYLHGDWQPLHLAILVPLLMLIHWWSYGHNSLMDTVMTYDQKDMAKRHHPLVNGKISFNVGHRVIHTGMVILTIIAILLTIMVAIDPIPALICIILWVVLGQAYNDGMSKESLLGPGMISLMTTAMVGWGWFLSHESLDIIGFLFLLYIFLLIYFQIAWDGSLKDITQPERSNHIKKLGGRIYYGDKGELQLELTPKAGYFGALLKASSIMVVATIAFINLDMFGLLWVATFGGLSLHFALDLIESGEFNRDKKLKEMSLEQIFAIYLPIPLIAPLGLALVLMVLGVVYFVAMNKWLWGASYPKV